jgi:hypothetical protein
MLRADSYAAPDPLDIGLFFNAAEEFGFMIYPREHAAQEEEIPCLRRRQLGAKGLLGAKARYELLGVYFLCLPFSVVRT